MTLLRVWNESLSFRIKFILLNFDWHQVYTSWRVFQFLTFEFTQFVLHMSSKCTMSLRRSDNFHTVKSTVRKMNTPVLIPFSTWVHAIFFCLWTVLLFLTWLYTHFWLYMMQKHPYFEKHSLSLQTRPVIRFATIYDRMSLTHESRMTILSSTQNRIESRRFISEEISAELDI